MCATANAAALKSLHHLKTFQKTVVGGCYQGGIAKGVGCCQVGGVPKKLSTGARMRGEVVTLKSRKLNLMYIIKVLNPSKRKFEQEAGMQSGHWQKSYKFLRFN